MRFARINWTTERWCEEPEISRAPSSASGGTCGRRASIPKAFTLIELLVVIAIVQRFNAGTYVRPDQVPKGRLINGANRFAFSRPFRTQILRTSFPALKRRATFAMSLRDNRSRSEWARTKNNSNKNRARRGARTGPAPGPTAGGCRAGNAYSLRHVCSRAFEKPGRKR